MVKEVSRYIKREVERELWARSAGRCQFNGCNRLVYKSPVTQEKVNISEKAHIYSFSEKGPRGWGPFVFNRGKLNSTENLMLMCHDCHKTIDQDKQGDRYSANLLTQWKREHEQRVHIVTGIAPDNKSHVVLYGANIGSEKSPLRYVEAVATMFPDKYPAEEKAINLSMVCEHEDRTADYWQTESKHLTAMFYKQIEPRIKENNPAHFSLFSLAPQPLLIQLGTLFTDKISVNVFQPTREPKSWEWHTTPDGFEFQTIKPSNFEKPPVLIVSLSDKISEERITSITGEKVSIWELTVPSIFLHNDLMRSQEQLLLFRKVVRKLMGVIKGRHGQSTPLQIFPAMPVSCAIEMGRVRMPKADMPWIIFDQNNKEGKFIKALEITGGSA